MDPRISFQAWKLILRVWLLNVIFVPLIFTIALLGLGSGATETANYSQIYYPFFLPWSELGFFFIEYAIQPALNEEFLFRFPIIALIWIANSLGYHPKKSSFSWVLIVILAVVLNALWAYGHISYPAFMDDQPIVYKYYFIFPPVFFAGLSWLWLTFKIRPSWPWPSIVAHTLANTSIYVFIKIAVMLGYKFF